MRLRNYVKPKHGASIILSPMIVKTLSPMNTWSTASTTKPMPKPSLIGCMILIVCERGFCL